MDTKTVLILLLVLLLIILLFVSLIRPKKVATISHIEVPQYNTTQLNVKPINKNNEKLDKYFEPITSCLPMDYPDKEIGDCPYTKPQKRDLPIANAPMCLLTKEQNMYLDKMI